MTEDFRKSARFKAFTELADAQRGKPEGAMNRAQMALTKRPESSANAYGYALEHVGDLTHRMSEQYAHYPGAAWGRENVEPKVNIGLRIATNPVDSRNIANIPKIPEIDEYAKAHTKLPVYNDAQYHARQAAVQLGMGNLNQSASHLRVLKNMLDNGTYEAHASQYNPDYEGKNGS